MAPECPGSGRCYARAGAEPCRVHGCRVCGSVILADTESWPAPLCIEHAPELLISAAHALRRAVECMLDHCDGVHQTSCAVWLLMGRAASDSELARNDGRSLCTCGFFAVRQDVRRRFGIAARDTDRAPAPQVGAS